MPEMDDEAYVYILECSNGTYYTGWTHDLDARVQAHNDGKGSKYTRSKRPVKLVYYKKMKDRISAMREEYRIKTITRAEKIALARKFAEEQ